jgi:hypothetical protein
MLSILRSFVRGCKSRLPQSLVNGENDSDTFRLLLSIALLALYMICSIVSNSDPFLLESDRPADYFIGPSPQKTSPSTILPGYLSRVKHEEEAAAAYRADRPVASARSLARSLAEKKTLSSNSNRNNQDSIRMSLRTANNSRAWPD